MTIEIDAQRQSKEYVVGLIERYESRIQANSKAEAIKIAGERGHAGSSPVWSKITCTTAKYINWRRK